MYYTEICTEMGDRTVHVKSVKEKKHAKKKIFELFTKEFSRVEKNFLSAIGD